MGPKRKPGPGQKSRPRPRPALQPRSTTARARPGPRRSRAPVRGNTPVWTEWFTVSSTNITSTAKQGPLDAIALHPTTLPDTPYATANLNFTHRIEYRWQIKCYITTASFTGTRIACLAFTDPNQHDRLTTAMVWGAVANGRGAMMDSCGNSSKAVSFQLQTATRVLSNAKPPVDDNLIGYAAAHLITWILQGPIGLKDNSDLNATIMARCLQKGLNPIPGFGIMQMQPSGPYQPVGQAAWKFTRLNADKTANEQSMYEPNVWAVSHTGNIPLAGGIYFLFHGAYGPAPKVGTGSQASGVVGSGGGITITGEVKTGCVYATDFTFPPWMNNRGQKVVPRYFACIAGFATSHCLLVGFDRLEDACAQVNNKWLVIPGGAELCLKYSGTPRWRDFNPNVSQTKQQEISFWLVFDNGYSKPVYSTVNPGQLSISTARAAPLPNIGLSTENLHYLAQGGWQYHPDEFDDNPFDTDEETTYDSAEDEEPHTLPIYPSAPEQSLTDEQLEEQLRQASTALARLKCERDERRKQCRKEEVLAPTHEPPPTQTTPTLSVSYPTLPRPEPSAPPAAPPQQQLSSWVLTPDRGWIPSGQSDLDPPRLRVEPPHRSSSLWDLLKTAIKGRRHATKLDD